MSVDRNRIIEDTIERIRSAIPNATIGRYKEYGDSIDVKTISTGSLAADFALGGGFAEGRLINIVGHTSSGKTTLALTACAELQKTKPEANILYVDAECALDPKYAMALGVNLDEVHLIQPDSGEDGYLAAEMYIASGVADMVIIDSIAAMIPRAMFEVEFGEQAQIGMGARLDSQGIARLFGGAHKNNTTVILINQWKKGVKVNAFDRTDGISGNYYQPGGETFKFFVSQMLEVQRVGKIYEGEELVSHQTRVRVLKNKIAPPGIESDFFITFGVGVDRAQEAIELGIQSGDVERTGRANYQITGEEETFYGRPKFVEYLRENPDKLEIIRNNIKDKFLANHRDDVKISEDTEVVPEAPIID